MSINQERAINTENHIQKERNKKLVDSEARRHMHAQGKKNYKNFNWVTHIH